MDITRFLGSVNKTGIARTSSFMVTITPPGGGATLSGGVAGIRDLPWRVDGASFPSRSVTVIDAEINNAPSYKIAGLVAFEPVTLSIIVSDDYNESRIFESWLDLVVGGDYRLADNADYRTNYYDDYKGSITISIYDATGELTKNIELVDAYPMQINYMPLTWEGKDVMKMAVTVAYKYIREKKQ